MPIAILDPFSGIAGDMTLGALVDVGLDAEWLRALPARLGLTDVSVRIQRVRRSDVACTKVDFDIPPQPHERHISEIREIVARAGVPAAVRARADAAFTAIATVEGEIHGVPPERVHLHEVGAVDAILDVVGAVWGFEQLRAERVYCGPVVLGDGMVKAAHGVLPVPAPATLKLLEGHAVRPGPEGAGELVTPTGAALVRVLSSGPPPDRYVPLRSGFGAGAKDPHGRPNALRLVLAEMSTDGSGTVDMLLQLSADIDDMDGEQLALVADELRADGALDVVLVPTLMKKGRPGVRLDVLAPASLAATLQDALLTHSTTIGVRRTLVERFALPRQERTVCVLDHDVRVKVVVLPNGARRAKPEIQDVARVAERTGRPLREVLSLADDAAERMLLESVPGPAS
jgi:uncharacterized protein (TIGR00299 family) protein